MAAIDRKFYQSWRGPAPADQDSWWLVFDAETRRLLVRHEWQASRHNGFDEFEVAEWRLPAINFKLTHHPVPTACRLQTQGLFTALSTETYPDFPHAHLTIFTGNPPVSSRHHQPAFHNLSTGFASA
jgi:hypothetical protein